MPLKRTPPPVPPPQPLSDNASPAISEFASPLQHYPSESNVAEIGIEAGMSAASSTSSIGRSGASTDTNITTRSKNTAKRRRAEDNGTDDITKSEIMEMFIALQRQHDEKLDVVLNSIQEVKLSVDLMSVKYEEALLKIDSLEREKVADKTYIFQLENRLDMLEHKMRSTSLEIRNIPPVTNETKEDIKKIVVSAANLFIIPLQNSDIKDVYRINTKSGNKPIIVDFTSVLLRDRFLSSFKKYNKQHPQDKLNTTNILANAVNYGNIPVYISENLSQKERKLFYLARDFAKRNNYTFCWTSFGRILLRKEEGSPQIRIANENDLNKLETK